MKKTRKFSRSILTSLFALMFLLSSVLGCFADNISSPYTAHTQTTVFDSKYKSVIEDGNWQYKYVIKLKDLRTGRFENLSIPVINNGKLDEISFRKSVQGKYEVISFKKFTNPNYKSSDDVISAKWFETAFDVGCLMMSLSDFQKNPGFWTGLGVVLDGASVAFPGIPAVGGRLINWINKSAKLQDALKHGVNSYTDLRRVISGTGKHAHHIMPKTYATYFNISDVDKMFCVALDSATHSKITSKFNSYLPHGNGQKYSAQKVKDVAKKIYQELYDETGDELFLFMKDFIEQGQYLKK